MILAEAKEDTDPLKSSVTWTKTKKVFIGLRERPGISMCGWKYFLSEPGQDLWFLSIWCWLNGIYSARKRDDAPDFIWVHMSSHSFSVQGIIKLENSNSINKSIGDGYKLNKNSQEHCDKKKIVFQSHSLFEVTGI